MSSRTEPLSELFSRTLGRRSARKQKPLEQEGNELLAPKVRRSSKAKSQPSKRVRPGTGAGGAAVSGAKKTDDVLAQLESDLDRYSTVDRGRKATSAPATTVREKQLEQFKRATADNAKSVNRLLAFGLETQQARTLEHMLGKLFGQPIKLASRGDVRTAQEAANKLIAGMKGHWDAALPKGQTRESLLKSAYDRLQAELKKNPDLNPSRFIRKELFDPWRKRFMQRLGADSALVDDLRKATGVKIVTDSDVPKFSLDLRLGNTKAQIGFDVDHAETRLSDAVKAAKRPEDLASVIESDGMQLLTPRENRIQIEALRKATREYFAAADEATIDYLRRMGTNAAALNSEIDEMLDALDRAGDFI